MSFSSLGLPQSILHALTELEFTNPYPIQEQAIPAILKKKDIMAIAKTGSGKTASFVLPILTNLLDRKLSKDRYVDVLVLVPTRELAVQVGEVFKDFASRVHGEIKVLSVFGGVSINPQMKAVRDTNILIATPGRLLDLLETKSVYISKVETLVLDEADKMLNLGFKDEMNKIFKLLPEKRQNLLFSATISDDINDINTVLLTNPVEINIASEEEDSEELINQVAYFISEEDKGPMLRYLIKNKNMTQVLVFASSVRKVDNITNKLIKNGIEARSIHSKKSQGARTDTLAHFKLGRIQVLVATDLISRGIDIEFLPYVINYELPRSPKDYIHRIGRTGRAGSMGEAISLITPDEEAHFKIIEKKMGKKVPVANTAGIDLKGY